MFMSAFCKTMKAAAEFYSTHVGHFYSIRRLDGVSSNMLTQNPLVACLTRCKFRCLLSIKSRFSDPLSCFIIFLLCPKLFRLCFVRRINVLYTYVLFVAKMLFIVSVLSAAYVEIPHCIAQYVISWDVCSGNEVFDVDWPTAELCFFSCFFFRKDVRSLSF